MIISSTQRLGSLGEQRGEDDPSDSFDGACTNQAESYFSRLRRSEIGIHHHISGQYLDAYAAEMAWREDTRREANGTLYRLTAAAAASHPQSKIWTGYWQRRKAA